jgi:hypothetical protein
MNIILEIFNSMASPKSEKDPTSTIIPIRTLVEEMRMDYPSFESEERVNW